MASEDLDAVTWPVQLTNTMHRALYPLLEPSNPALAAIGKTVLITGVSGGVGKAIAESWAIAGAKAIFITGRKVDVLEGVSAQLRDIPAAARTKIVVHAADFRSENEMRELWATAQSVVGKIDVLINDAEHMSWGAIGAVEPSEWWLDYDPSKPSGTVITLSTGAAGMSLPNMSSYISSKLAQTRIMEIFHAEQPDVRCFTLLPGLLKTAMTAEAFKPFARDDPMLAGGMTLFLSTSRADWLRGGIVSVNWDIEEMEAHREEIIRENRTKLTYINAKLQKSGHPWSG
ncbi:hypothetical protein N0V82_004360 [Gnomoniopsis sp. IMI 355080]|nr:hypothetical protein N0V82_004360 [Gnomoniopsis sp. IMI 355080]